jgi:hypothetical protein
MTYEAVSFFFTRDAEEEQEAMLSEKTLALSDSVTHG